MARRFWLTVRVPDDAKDGMYTASITVKAEKGGVKTIPVRLSVLPFRLPEPEHLFSLYGICVLPMLYYPSMKADYPKNLEIVLRDLRAHGVNYIGEHFGGLTAAVAWQDGKAVVTNTDEFEKQMALVRSLGFRDGTIGMDGGCLLEDLTSGKEIRGLPREKFIEGWHKTLTDYFKARGWPHPYFCYGDEPNIPETLNKLTAANKAVHAVSPDIWMGIAYHVESPESYELLKSLDVHHFKAFLKVDDFLLARKYAKQLLNCNMGMTREAFGLREWRAAKERKTDGCITYAYTGNHVDIYYDLDAREGDYNQAPPRLDGTLATCATWERIREGIDDFKYALAIEKLAGDPASAQEKKAAAEQLLKEAYDIGGIAGDGGFIEKAMVWRAKAQQVLSGK
jgi:hypothetical protein